MDPTHTTFSPGLADTDSDGHTANRKPLPPPLGAAYPSEVIDARPRTTSRFKGDLPAGLEHMSFGEHPRISTRRRLVYMRMAILIALGASAALTVDLIRPGRAFCPLEQACAAASASVLGSIMGIPTAILGLGSFAALLLVTFFPVGTARKLLMPAGLFAGGVGLWLLVYQAFFLGSFCPLCVVVDTMALMLGALILTWESPAWGRMRWQDRESHSVAMAWLMVAALVVLAPFAWPRSQAPAWEPITPLTEADFAELPDDAPASGESSLATSPNTPHGATPDGALPPPRLPTSMRQDVVPPMSVTFDPSPVAPPLPTPGVVAEPASPPVVAAPPAPSSASAQAAMAAREPETPPPASTPTARVAPVASAARPKPILIVEYLNAYCRHCRATHKRLEAVLAKFETPVRRRRIYTWASKEDPLWARACFFAREQKRENAMFRELLKSSAQTPEEIFAAAERAGLDTRAMQRYVARDAPTPALVRNRRLMQSARLKGLPTFDIGRRRLLGEQSMEELRTALEAARHAPRN